MLLPRLTRPLPIIVLILAVICGLAACSKTNSAQPPVPRTTPTTRSAASSVLTTPSASPSPTRPSLVLSDCNDQFRQAINTSRAREMSFTCGKLSVPLDYAKPAGTQVTLFVVKVHSNKRNSADRVGSLLVNPGGPGASGVNLAAGLVNGLSDDIFDRFDLIGFDPRGVGLSTPLTCISDREKDQLAALDPDVRTPAGRAVAKATSARVAKGCVAKYGASLGHYNTEESAHDMDEIRSALGEDKLNYLGFSYGTRLGAAYAHQFPKTVRAAVLDGAVDPVSDEATIIEGQAKAFEDAFSQFAADCQRRAACAALGSPRPAVMALVKAANRNPIPSQRTGETRKATGGIVTLAVVAALYDSSQWPALGAALIAGRNGDSEKLFALADQYNERDLQTGHYSNLQDANLAVNCNDTALRPTDNLVAAKAVDWISKYPLFGPNAAASLYACQGWPQSGHVLPPASAPGAPPILVIGTVHDPATPYAAAGVLAKALGSGVVLSWDGEGHTAYPKTKCVRAKVDTYLITAKIPTGNSCPRS